MFYKYLSYCLYTLAVISVLYCQESVWRLSYLIAFTFVLLALHQLISPKFKISGKIKQYRDPRYHIRELEKMLAESKKRSRRKQSKTKNDQTNEDIGPMVTQTGSTTGNVEDGNRENDMEGNRQDLGFEN